MNTRLLSHLLTALLVTISSARGMFTIYAMPTVQFPLPLTPSFRYHHLAAAPSTGTNPKQQTQVDPPWALPDWSYVGYHAGRSNPRPQSSLIFNVTSYGAKADGTTDDSFAIQAAIDAAAEARGGTVILPPGRYALYYPLNITSSRIVLAGADRNTTTLFFPRPLAEALPSPYLNAAGTYSRYCWKHGFINIMGRRHTSGSSATRLAAVALPSRGAVKRGTTATLKVKWSTYNKRLVKGDTVWLFQSDPHAPPANYTFAGGRSLVAYLYGWQTPPPNCNCTSRCHSNSESPPEDRDLILEHDFNLNWERQVIIGGGGGGIGGGIGNGTINNNVTQLSPSLAPTPGSLSNTTTTTTNTTTPIASGTCLDDIKGERDVVRWVAKVSSVNGNLVTLDRVIPFDVRPEWSPQLHRFPEYRINRDSGVQNLRIEFPLTPAAPHHLEKGYNGIEIQEALDAYVSNVDIVNPDSGIFVRDSNYVTLSGVTTSTTGQRGGRTLNGHIGIAVTGSVDVKVSRFEVKSKLIHDTTVVKTMMVAWQQGKGKDLNLDAHRYATYATLYSDVDVGDGQRVFTTGGIRGQGFPIGAYTTYYNVHKHDGSAITIRNTTEENGECSYGGFYISYVGNYVPQSSYCKENFVALVPADGRLSPQDLYAAQLARRFGTNHPTNTTTNNAPSPAPSPLGSNTTVPSPSVPPSPAPRG